MTKKKKVLSVALAAVIAAVGIAGGSLAYFTDTDKATNTFTTGNVKIDLVEKKADMETDFENGEKLLPGTSTKNAVAKRVMVENTGANDAWIWVKVSIPTALDDTDDASKNSFHFNTYGQFGVDSYDSTWTKAYAQTPITDGIIDANHNMVNNKMVSVEDGLWTDGAFIETKDGYNVYVYKMEKKLAAGKLSLPVIRQVYMDEHVSQNTAGEGFILADGTTTYNGSWELKVEAYAMQADGFLSVEEAYAAYNA